MPEHYDDITNAHIDRDDSGVVRGVLHTERRHAASARTPQLAAREYLENFSGLLGLEEAQLLALGLDLEPTPTSNGVEYRLWSEKTQFDTATVTFSQSYFGLPIWEAGLAVQMALNPIRIIGAQSTAHTEVSAERPSDQALRGLANLNEEGLAERLGISADDKRFHRRSLKVERNRFYVYRYYKDQRVRPVDQIVAAPAEKENAPVPCHPYPLPTLPPVPNEIVDGRHYVVAAIYFTLGVPETPELRWVALVEANTLAVVLLRALVASVDGFVFLRDPMTTNGGPLPNASDAALNPLRSVALLKELNPPVCGSYTLTGDLVQVKDVEPPLISPPIGPVGTDFNFNARTDNFAAVNAYYHADAFFRLVKEFGFDLNVYFGGTPFPTVVDHRGIDITVNAHCLGNGAFGILQTTFALADLSNQSEPLGIACDQRVVLHELAGHGTLYNHVNGPHFGFAHSAGDSIAAVLNDPNSRAPDRFMTFPWLNSSLNRRHDRTPAAGWGWNGSIALNPFWLEDICGYNNEQILSTTHFRIYRSIGGDSTELAIREFAGRYVAYLIFRTIGTLTHPTNPPNALTYASFMMAAEVVNWTTAGEIGGCYWKVIRWAFERQGLYQPASMPKPNDNEGAPPPIDVYIDDGRHGEYMYSPAKQYPYLQKFWETTEIWNRHKPDGQTQHQTPIVGRRNYAYVRVKNRGTLAAANVVVHGWHCRPSAGLVWPDDWKPMTTASRPIPSLPAGGQSVVGPFEWHPEHKGHECMLMSATVPGDLANNDVASGLPTAIGPTPLWRLVPCDNNLGLRAVIPVPGGGYRDALVDAFKNREVWASNPFAKTSVMEIRPVLPSFLTSRGWTMLLDNPGGGSFSLGPRDSRRVRPRLVSGNDFTATELLLTGYTAIELIVIANGIVVGGLTFFLDPELHYSPSEFVEENRPEDHRDTVAVE